jgi:hypothetical protein
MLRRVAKETLTQIIELVRVRGFMQHGRLIEALEDNELLERAATWLNEQSSKGPQESESQLLAKYADERLAKRSLFEQRVEDVRSAFAVCTRSHPTNEPRCSGCKPTSGLT